MHDAARPLASRRLFDAVIDALRRDADAAAPDRDRDRGSGPGRRSRTRRWPRVTPSKSWTESGCVLHTLDPEHALSPCRRHRPSELLHCVAHARPTRDSGSDATDDAMLVEALGGRVLVVAGQPPTSRSPTARTSTPQNAFSLHDQRTGTVDRAHRTRASTSTGSPKTRTARSCSGASSSRVHAAWTATATLTRWRTRWPTPSSAPSTSAISAGISPTPTQPGRAQTASSCSPRSCGWRPRGVHLRQRGLHHRRRHPPPAPHTPTMTERLGAVLDAPVSVKASRAEGIGALGRAEGILCLAVVLMEPA